MSGACRCASDAAAGDRRGAKNKQANSVRLAPSIPKHNREGHANSPLARRLRARRARRDPRTPIDAIAHELRASRSGTAVAITACVMDDTRLRPSPAVRAATSEDGLILLDVDGGLVLASNVVGARIWQLIEQRGTPDHIARRLAEEFAISVDRASQDVRAFVANLVERGLIAEDRCD